jgi:hypothetical protein
MLTLLCTIIDGFCGQQMGRSRKPASFERLCPRGFLGGDVLEVINFGGFRILQVLTVQLLGIGPWFSRLYIFVVLDSIQDYVLTSDKCSKRPAAGGDRDNLPRSSPPSDGLPIPLTPALPVGIPCVPLASSL